MDQGSIERMVRALDTNDARFGDLMDDTTVSGHALLAEAHRRASALSTVTDRRIVVAVSRSLDADFLSWTIGTHLANGVVAPLYPTLRPLEREAVLSVLEPDVIVADAGRLDEFPGYQFAHDLGAFVSERSTDRVPLPSQADLVLHSSGSTGQPKGILLNGASFLRSGFSFGERLGVQPGDRYFCPLPMAHSGGLIMGWWAAALHGAVLLGAKSGDFSQVARRLAEQRPAFVGAVDTFFYRWEQATGGGVALGRVAWTTGDQRTLERVHRGCRFEHVVRPYGLTEASPNVGVGDPRRGDGPPADPRIWVHEDIQVQISPVEGASDAAEGEILVTGDCVAPGYLLPDGVRPVTDDDGWIHTGDLGSWNPDGSLDFTGRVKEMLKVGGLNVWPQEIEAVLQDLDMERPMCVVGRRDDEYGELPVLVVEGDLGPSDRERIARALSTLPRIKQPREVVEFDELPVTASGKMDRRGITKLVNG